MTDTLPTAGQAGAPTQPASLLPPVAAGGVPAVRTPHHVSDLVLPGPETTRT
ncbi:hypothetical protein [Streptomyces lasiicapitis]|uniref:hypothetical protein n=1 Tax=Streptomyces lasiicapitis TaxID=1923961 RepID=UPI0036AF136A